MNDSSHFQSNDSVLEEIFFGQISENNIFPFPSLTPDHIEMGKEMTQAIERFAKENIDSKKMDENQQIPDQVRMGLAELGLCGLAVPEEYGGLGLNYSLYSRSFAQVAGNDGSCATMLGAHQSIGYRALLNEGTKAQKDKWLPKLASGEIMAAFCLTEPSSGSDAYSIKTKAMKQEDGSWKINGQKLWITNAGLAGFYTVFAKTEHHVDHKTVEKISCFIVEKDRPGVSFGEKEKKMGIRASETRAVYFDNVVIPADNLLGEEGKGFKIAMNVLNSGRLSLGAGCVNGMKSALSLSVNHTKNRKQFDRNIHEFGLIQDKLAKMASKIYATESMVYFTTGKMDQGMKEYSLESAACKIFGSENLWEVADMSMQIAAGNGYMQEYPYELFMRDSRINLIFEGTNEILRCFLALSGVKGPSDGLKDLGKISDLSRALERPIKSLGVLSGFAKSRISKMIPSKTLTMHHADLEEQSTQFSDMLSAFSIQVENSLIKYGKKIIHHELIQGRLANMAISLYAMVAVISRTTAILNHEAMSQDKKSFALTMAKLACAESRHKFMVNYKAMGKNNDKDITKASEYVVEHDGYNLDILDF